LIDLPKDFLRKKEQAESQRFEAWLDLNSTIGGIEVKQMSLKDYFILEGLQSPIMQNGNFTQTDLAVFLWVLSPDYSIDPKKRDVFCKKIIGINLQNAIADLRTYLESTFVDADTLQGGEGAVPKHSLFITQQIDLYAKEYGWTIDQILSISVRQIFQLNTAIQERYALQNGEKMNRMTAIQAMETELLMKELKKRSQKN
jgi:hypothetical protein